MRCSVCNCFVDESNYYIINIHGAIIKKTYKTCLNCALNIAPDIDTSDGGYYTAAEAAYKLKICRETVLEWCKKGKLKHIITDARSGRGGYLVSKQSVDNLIKETIEYGQN